MLSCATAFGWRARTVLEYQNMKIVKAVEAEALDGARAALAADKFASGGRAVELAAGGATLRLAVDVPLGTGTVWIYARVPGVPVDGPWPPIYVEMDVKQPGGAVVHSRTRVPSQPTYQCVTRLFFLAPRAGTYEISLRAGKGSERALLVDRIEIRDPLDWCERKALKTGRCLVDDAELKRIRAAAQQVEKPKAKKAKQPLTHVLGADATVADMAQYAETVWKRLPPINAILGRPEMKAIQDLVNETVQRAEQYELYGDRVSAREAAVLLAALAQRYPTFDSRVQSFDSNFSRVAYERFSQASGHPYPPVALQVAYDRIFDAIKDDADLARAIWTKIPSVQTPEQFRALLDCNVLQYELALCFRFTRKCRLLGWEDWTLTTILVLGPNAVGQKWMDRIFEKTYADLTGNGGLAEYLVNGICRDGCNYDGATCYTVGVPTQLARVPMLMARFAALGGRVPAFAYDPKVNPRLLEGGWFRLNYRTAGGFQTIFGDGGGAIDRRFDTVPGLGEHGTGDVYDWYWRHTGDARYAWMAAACGRPRTMSEKEWAAIIDAAKTTRDPVLHGPTVTMPAFGSTTLELGAGEDDVRLKGAAILRFGTGRAHQHGDLLDLTINAFNERIIGDGGRSGWPWMRFTAQHNTIEVDRDSFQSTGVNSGAFGWPLTMCETGLARFASAGGRSSVHPQLTDYRRDVAMVDLGIHGEGDDRVRHFYVFDVNRVGGGLVHTYCSHAMPGEIGFNTKTEPASDNPHGLLYKAADARTGVTVDPFVTTWTMTSRRHSKAPFGLRHYLFGWGGLPFWTAKGTHRNYNNHIPFLWIERESKTPQHATYFSVFEPWWREPNLTSVKPLSVRGGGDGSDAARAVRVVSRWGRTDTVIISEGGRNIQVEGGIETDAHFVFIAEQGGAVVQASMVGGTYLRRGGLSLAAPAGAYEGTIKLIDLRSGRLTLAPGLPAGRAEGAFLIFGRQPHVTGEYLAADKDGLRLLRACELFRSPIVSIDEKAGTVHPSVALPITAADPSAYVGCTATNEAQDKFWRVERTDVAEMWIPLLTPISDAEVTDADGDGKRTVRLTGFAPPEKTRDPVILYYGPFQKPVRMKQFNRAPFKEPVVLEVTRVDAKRRVLYFKPPADYDLVWQGWAYEGVTVTNEAGNRQWRASVPAREFNIVLSGPPVRKSDFTVTGSPFEGPREARPRIHLYDFGRSDPYRLETYATVRRDANGVYQTESNTRATAAVK